MIEVVDTQVKDEPLPSKLDGIMVGFDPQKQTVVVDFHPEAFRTWDWVVGVLAMGLEKAKEMAQLAKVQAFQQQQRAAFEHEAIKRNLQIH